MSDTPTTFPHSRAWPWKTIAGAVLWCLGVVLQCLWPQHPNYYPQLFQGAGVALCTFGAVAAVAKLITSAPFLRFGGAATDHSVFFVVLMAGGGAWFAILKSLEVLTPSHVSPYMTIAESVSVLVAVIGWRMWIHQTVKRTR